MAIQYEEERFEHGDMGDNEEEYIHTRACGTIFEVPSRYEIQEELGRGAYGVVVAAKDKVTNERVAIKKVGGIFARDVEFQKRIFREITILNHLQHHDNIVCLKELILPKRFEEMKDVYIVTDLMDYNLRDVIHKKNEFNDQEVQYFLYQLLRALKYVHSANVLHRDIKPQNILLNCEGDLKICDFGISRGFEDTKMNMSTANVSTLWYRSPELLMYHKEASTSIDIWSIGCVFAEMLSHKKKHNKVLFRGRNHLDQVNKIIDFCGTPREEEMNGSLKAKTYIHNLPKKNAKCLKEMFPNRNQDAIDLLGRMLCFDPKKRITVEEALKHEYFESMHDPQDEPVCLDLFKDPFPILDIDFSAVDMKRLFHNEIVNYKRRQMCLNEEHTEYRNDELQKMNISVRDELVFEEKHKMKEVKQRKNEVESLELR